MPLPPPPQGFVRHGDRLRLNNISFSDTDAFYIASEAERRDVPAAYVLREVVREWRTRREAKS